MREILFRGKRIDNGEFVYGYLNLSLCRRGGYHHIITVPSEDLEEEETQHIVDARTIGEYSGVKDCNETKAFENDTCNYEYWISNGIEGGITAKGKGAIIFEDGSFKIEDLETKRGFPLHYADLSFEITGNTHD